MAETPPTHGSPRSLFALAAAEGTTLPPSQAPPADPPEPRLILPTDVVRPTMAQADTPPPSRIAETASLAVDPAPSAEKTVP